MPYRNTGVLAIQVLVTDSIIGRSSIQRAFDLHPNACPVYRSIHTSIDITKELEIVET